jgi:hypothetical protein
MAAFKAWARCPVFVPWNGVDREAFDNDQDGWQLRQEPVLRALHRGFIAPIERLRRFPADLTARERVDADLLKTCSAKFSAKLSALADVGSRIGVEFEPCDAVRDLAHRLLARRPWDSRVGELLEVAVGLAQHVEARRAIRPSQPSSVGTQPPAPPPSIGLPPPTVVPIEQMEAVMKRVLADWVPPKSKAAAGARSRTKGEATRIVVLKALPASTANAPFKSGSDIATRLARNDEADRDPSTISRAVTVLRSRGLVENGALRRTKEGDEHLGRLA